MKILSKTFITMVICILLTGLSNLVLAGEFTVFGPKDFLRGTGTPVTVKENFAVLNPNTQFFLRLNNGRLQDLDAELVSSSIISINGQQVLGPENFNQKVKFLEIPINLQLNNTMEVELRGKPGGLIALRIVGIDNTAPNIQIIKPVNGSLTNINPHSISLSFGDDISGIEPKSFKIFVNDIDKTNLFNVNVTGLSGSALGSVPLPEGTNIIKASISDFAGNIGSATSSFIMDTTPPVIFSLSPTQDSILANAKPNISAQFSDPTSGIDISTVKITLDGLDVTANSIITSTGFYYTLTVNLSDGTHSVTVDVKDKATNPAVQASWFFVIDITPPVITNINPANGSTTSELQPTISVAYNDLMSEVNISSVSLILDGANVTAYSNVTEALVSFTPTTNLAVGTHTFQVQVSDKADNAATVQSTFIVQMAGPPLPANAPPEIVSAPVTFASENEVYRYEFYAIDPDGDSLSYSLTLAPVGTGIDPHVGVITWTPTSSQVGKHSVTAAVTDGKEIITQSFVVEVKANILEASQSVYAVFGGSVEVSDPLSEIFGTKIIIPPNALPKDCIISITKISNPSYAPPGCLAVDIQPSLTFNEPVTIEILFTDQYISTYGINEENPPTLHCFNQSLDVWEEVENVIVDLVNKKVTANVMHFSKYVVASPRTIWPFQKCTLYELKKCKDCNSGRNVLLIHGINDSYEGYKGKDHKLFTADDSELLKFAYTHYDNVYFYNYPTWGHIKTNAHILAGMIRGCIPNDCQFDIIAHSMGGLVARYMVEKGIADANCPLTNVRNVVLLGTPNDGTTLDLIYNIITKIIPIGSKEILRMVCPGGCDAISGSDFINELNKNAGCGTQTATLYAVSGEYPIGSGNDGMVPVGSAQGITKQDKTIVCPGNRQPTTNIRHGNLAHKMISADFQKDSTTTTIAKVIEGWLQVIPIPPNIKDIAPTGIVTTSMPTISFTIESPICNDIDISSSDLLKLGLLKLDGESIDYEILEDGLVYCSKGIYEITGTGPQIYVSFTPNYFLGEYEHSVEVSVRDIAASGLDLADYAEYWTKKDWTFEVIQVVPEQPHFRLSICPPDGLCYLRFNLRCPGETACGGIKAFYGGEDVTNQTNFQIDNTSVAELIEEWGDGYHKVVVRPVSLGSTTLSAYYMGIEFQAYATIIVSDSVDYSGQLTGSLNSLVGTTTSPGCDGSTISFTVDNLSCIEAKWETSEIIKIYFQETWFDGYNGPITGSMDISEPPEPITGDFSWGFGGYISGIQEVKGYKVSGEIVGKEQGIFWWTLEDMDKDGKSDAWVFHPEVTKTTGNFDLRFYR